MSHLLYPLLAQLPLGTPNPDDNKPLDFTDPFDVIVFIILPILIVVLYIIWKKKKNQNK
ncbi:adenylosuccinate synthetase [Formosa sediminum]|uniref:Adenylosuccinate synthetase n=1 Tax=Formosa sediminum TaxID=2594004 RepID=A0A516GTW6_9FLAO|nr:adenylosuccinate synthetase [Formosa sediminum]QDO94935.1 adenylosuccinate synthetase [Formosa sediminum]